MNTTHAFISFETKPITGVQKENPDGTFDVLLGEIGTKNTAGVYYESTQPVRALFAPSSRIVTKMQDGQIFGEAGHPMRHNMSNEVFADRVVTVEPSLYSHQILKLSVIKDPHTVGKYQIYGKILPFGVHGDSLRKSLLSPTMNTAFSIRGFSTTRKTPTGPRRTLTYVVTWDWVTSPGIATANKRNWSSKNVTIESDVDICMMVDGCMTCKTREQLEEVATESDIALQDVMKTMKQDTAITASYNW